MFRLIVQWVLSAIALVIVSRVVPGYYVVNGVTSVLIAAVVIGLMNALLGLSLKAVAFPLTIILFGVFLVVINTGALMLAPRFFPGFQVHGPVPAVWGAAVLAGIGLFIRAIFRD